MGQHEVLAADEGNRLQKYTLSLLKDVEALEYMIEHGMIESGLRRAGLEQEMFLVTKNGKPHTVSEEIIQDISLCTVVAELARYNLEYNMPPLELKGDFLHSMEEQLSETLTCIRKSCAKYDAEVCLVGILPSLVKTDLTLSNMSPYARYMELNNALLSSHGEDFHISIRGTDEYQGSLNNIMFESCNTSLQLHFQVDPENAADMFNLVQLITAPLTAAAENSPTLFGLRLWKETRIALFEDAVDVRNFQELERFHDRRCGFGTSWIKSIPDFFKERIARFRPLVTFVDETDSMETVPITTNTITTTATTTAIITNTTTTAAATTTTTATTDNNNNNSICLSFFSCPL
eukprot:Rmarinus@m.11147